MGANSATKCYKVADNVLSVLAIELFTGAQALDFRRPKKSSPKIEGIMEKYRKEVPFIENDVEMYLFMNTSKAFLQREFLNEA